MATESRHIHFLVYSLEGQADDLYELFIDLSQNTFTLEHLSDDFLLMEPAVEGELIRKNLPAFHRALEKMSLSDWPLAYPEFMDQEARPAAIKYFADKQMYTYDDFEENSSLKTSFHRAIEDLIGLKFGKFHPSRRNSPY